MPQRPEPIAAASARYGLMSAAATREWEEREARRAVTDWQLARYFEII